MVPNRATHHSIKGLSAIQTSKEHIHCVKSVGIRNFSGSYLLTFELNRERYGVSLRIFKNHERNIESLVKDPFTFKSRVSFLHSFRNLGKLKIIC